LKVGVPKRFTKGCHATGLLLSSLIPYNYRLAFYEHKIKAVKDIDCNLYAPFEVFFAIYLVFK